MTTGRIRFLYPNWPLLLLLYSLVHRTICTLVVIRIHIVSKTKDLVWLPLIDQYTCFFHQFKFQDVSDVNHGMRPFRIDCWLLTWERKGASHAEGKGAAVTRHCKKFCNLNLTWPIDMKRVFWVVNSEQLKEYTSHKDDMLETKL